MLTFFPACDQMNMIKICNNFKCLILAAEVKCIFNKLNQIKTFGLH